MIKRNFFKLALCILVCSLAYSCQSDYSKLVKKELATNVKNDSIFYGLKFGQTKKKFFTICWNLNKKQIASHGGSNNYVKTILQPTDSANKLKKMKMLFYARFNKDDIITGMDAKFSYSAWAPWNKDLQADKLLLAVKDTLLKWYPGNNFITLKNNVLVKVDGNRQIQLKKATEQEVSVLIEDLEYKYNKLVK